MPFEGTCTAPDVLEVDVREEITVRNPAVDVFLLPTHKKLPGYLSIPEQEKVLG